MRLFICCFRVHKSFKSWACCVCPMCLHHVGQRNMLSTYIHTHLRILSTCTSHLHLNWLRMWWGYTKPAWTCWLPLLRVYLHLRSCSPANHRNLTSLLFSSLLFSSLLFSSLLFSSLLFSSLLFSSLLFSSLLILSCLVFLTHIVSFRLIVSFLLILSNLFSSCFALSFLLSHFVLFSLLFFSCFLLSFLLVFSSRILFSSFLVLSDLLILSFLIILIVLVSSLLFSCHSFGWDVKPRSWLSVVIKKSQDVLRKRVGCNPGILAKFAHWPLTIMAS